MIKKEMYICVRFSDKASSVITDKDMKFLKSKLNKKFVKLLKTMFKPYDKKVKVWIDVFG